MPNDIIEKRNETVSVGMKLLNHFTMVMKLFLSKLSNKAMPRLEFGADDVCYQDDQHNLIHMGLSMFVNYPDGELLWKENDELAGEISYVLQHEIQHRLSTTQRAWLMGLSSGVRVILETLSIRYEGQKRRFPDEKSMDYFMDTILPKYNVHINKDALRKAVHFIMNSIEDGRIERLRAKKKPGFKMLMVWSRGKRWTHTPIEKPVDINNPKYFVSVLFGQILSIATMGICQKGFYRFYGGTPVETRLNGLLPEIRAGVLSGTCKLGMEHAIKICENLAEDIAEASKITPLDQIMQNIMQNLVQQMNGENSSYGANEKVEETGSGKSGANETTEESSSESNTSSENSEQGDDGFNIFSSSSSDLGNLGEESDKGVSGNENGHGDNTSNSSSKNEGKIDPLNVMPGGRSGSKGQEIDPNAEPDFDQVLEAMRRAAENIQSLTSSAVGSIKETGDSAKKEVYDDSSCPDVSKICTNFAEFKRQYKVNDDMPIDIEMRGRILNQKYRRYFQSLLVPKQRHCRSGYVNPKDLYRIKLRQTDLFMRKEKDEGFDGAVLIYIDNSGSMGSGLDSKRMFACQAAAIIEESFKGLLPIKIVGFDSSGSVNHEVIKNWGESFNKNCCWNYYLKGRTGCGTPTKNSLLIGKTELLARPEKNKLFILLTDETSSCAGDGLKSVIHDVRKSGIKLCGIYFENKINKAEADGFNNLFEGFDNISVEPNAIDEELCAIVERFAKS